MSRSRDLICMGRAAVDLYGEQIGARLEDVQTFAKYLGGSPTNTAVGASRLGLRVGLVSRVGDEHNGRFVRETLVREGVDVSFLATDPQRLTALVFLSIKDADTFPLLFYRQNCADMALCADDIDPGYIASAHALVVSGTHLSTPGTRLACLKAMHAARAAGTQVVLDIDYRPVLWGLTSPGLGERRYVASAAVSEQLQAVLPLCDLIVGTEEEVHIAGGSTDSAAALRRIRELSAALLVMKRGPMGCVAYPGAIPDDLDAGITGPGFPVEVFNVLGAGDAFMAGLLRGWVRGEPLADALRYANACGAIVVSRHGCAPAMPSWDELGFFLAHGSPHQRLREDAVLEQLHRSTTRGRSRASLAILAFDHRAQLEELAARHGAEPQRIAAFKALVARAAAQGYAAERARQASSDGFPLAGVILDGRYGGAELCRLTGSGAWIARPVERPGSRPLAFEDGEQLGLALRTWPREHVVKCLLSHHPDDDAALVRQQLARVAELARACHDTGHELLLELIPPREMPAASDTVARGVAQVYAAGIVPDWWKLPPPDAAGWAALREVIERHDPYCQGVLLLGLEASEEQLRQGFRAAAAQPLCRGFAVGRTLFADAAAAWFAGMLDDAGVIADIATRYQRLIGLWREARPVFPHADGDHAMGARNSTIGFIGLGMMGHGMAKNLLAKGYGVRFKVHRNRSKLADLLAAGAVEVASRAELVRGVDAVILCVTGSPEVEQIVNGEDGLLAAATPGLLVIDTSTAEPASAARIREAFAARGVTYVDAPLARTPQHAEAGTLNTMVGAAAEDFARARPILATFCENIVHVGPPGHGHVLKLISNMLAMTTAAAIAEAVATAAKAGLALPKMFEVIGAGGVNSGIFQMTLGRMLQGDLGGLQFTIANARKDLRYYTHLTEMLPTSSFIAEAAHQSFVLAGNLGLGDRYIASMFEAQEKLNDVQIVPR